MNLFCREGDHLVKVRTNPVPGERFCPDHGCELVRPPRELRSKSKAGLPGEQAARRRFRQVVCAHPCFFLDYTEAGDRRRPDHKCTYPLDAHHLIPKGWIKRELSLPPDELLALMFNPIIGAPLCRGAHEAVERGADFIYRDELAPDLIAFCERFDAQHPDERSLLERLHLDSPVREPARGSLPPPMEQKHKPKD